MNICSDNGLEPAPERSRKTIWKERLCRHWKVLAAVDFFTLEVWTESGLPRIMALFRMDLRTRQIEIAGMACKPSGIWMDRVARNLCYAGDEFSTRKRYLIYDRDPLFRAELLRTRAAGGAKSVKLPPRSLNLNPYAEGFVRAIKES